MESLPEQEGEPHTMATEMKALISKLNPPCKKALEAAASLCVQRTHYNVEIDHLVYRLNEQPDNDWQTILKHYEVDKAQIKQELSLALGRYKTGCMASPALSPHLLLLLDHAWKISSLNLSSSSIGSGALLLALIDNDQLRGILTDNCPGLLQIPRHTLKDVIVDLLRFSNETPQPSAPATPTATQALAMPMPARNVNEALDQYTINLTQKAKRDELDPICGRDNEIHQLIDILSRRKQNNPILVGDAGVGKTAIVEGLAKRIALGQVPDLLLNTEILSLDLGLLQAGAGVRGEFEERLKNILSEIQNAPNPIILFIDEAHSLIGAGGNSGTNDAANLLKPALARGELRTIAATTWPEYKRYIENDAALTRRFELVKINEPSTEMATMMLRQMTASLEKHHGVFVLDEAIQAAVLLSKRFLPHRRLPDKAINLLDTACARVAMGRKTVPPLIEELNNKQQLLTIELSMLKREYHQPLEHKQRQDEIATDLIALTDQVAMLTTQWQETKDLITKIDQLKEEIPIGDQSSHPLLEQLLQLDEQANGLCLSLNFTHLVNRQTIAQVLSSWTGIPTDSMLHHYNGLSAPDLYHKFAQNIIGQEHALTAIANTIVSYRSGLGDPSKPQGVFLLVGPSGVGKTETAQVLAETLTGHIDNLIRINLSEFREPHSVASLKGAPPGYVGYGKGGILTEAVRRNPYSVILLDEIEKAHPDVMTLFYQVFDKGLMEDGEGIEVNFRNTLIILTSNLGSELMSSDHINNIEQLTEKLQERHEDHFHPALIARTTIIPYMPLSPQSLKDITRLKLQALQKRLLVNHKIELTFSDSDIDSIIEASGPKQQGARGLEKIINANVLPLLSAKILEMKTNPSEIAHPASGAVKVLDYGAVITPL